MADTVLHPLLAPLIEADPARAAHLLESMSEDQAFNALRVLPAPLAATLLPHLQAAYAAALLGETDEQAVATVANRIDPKRAASILMHLSRESLERLLPHLSESLRREVSEQLNYPADSVGRMMSTQFLAFHETMKVEDAIRKIRALAQSGMPSSYLYVIDSADRLVGVLNMHSLMLAAEEAPLSTIMNRNVFSLHAFTEAQEAGKELTRRRYFAAPVVDAEGCILGIVRAEHLLADVHKDATENLLRMVGVGSDERAFSPMTYSLKRRLPWLHVNLATAFLAAAVVAYFEGLISEISMLAVFLPVIAGQGGNAGAQSLAIVMRGIVMREVPKERRLQLVAKETVLGLVNGIVTGIITGIIAWMWYGNITLGIVVTIGMIVNLLFAGMAGASIPLLMKAMRLDPAQCSSIILTTVTDVVGFVAFLSLALIFKQSLIG
ncbi:MAG: magnesium transporter [Phycisphaeraceae bacterium]|nr:magnesium transporter [Phycisphaeraceae bacterium]